MMAEELARQLDGILDSYNRRVEGQKADSPEKQEMEDAFFADFERVKVEAIKPAMEEVGKYLESKGQEYEIKDEISLFHGNPKITLEIFPNTHAEGYDSYENPSISFVAERVSLRIGIQKNNGMPGQPGGITGEAVQLGELTRDFVKEEIIELIKENFR